VERCPAEESCPLKMNIEGYTTAIAQGRFKEALDIVKEVPPFSASLARICPRPCEEKCKRSKLEEAIAIRSLKRFVADYYLWDTGEKTVPYPRTKEEKVAVVGSGPAGLTVALDLVKEGYGVTVFERSCTVGGRMANAIPDFNLPGKVPAVEINRIIDSGVEIRANVEIGKDLTLDDLFQEGYGAIFIATGLPKSLDLKIPGALQEVKKFLTFLHP
jgi:NADPH-dependent glutamate synthase beta subunit-like oxidoreductase